eukprot:6496495-Alexandrium_andersonii.AAC.1
MCSSAVVVVLLVARVASAKLWMIVLPATAAAASGYSSVGAGEAVRSSVVVGTSCGGAMPAIVVNGRQPSAVW